MAGDRLWLQFPTDFCGLRVCLIALLAIPQAHAEETQASNEPPGHRLIWSMGARIKVDDMGHDGSTSIRPMLGLRYGRWRTGPADADTWHRFGQLRTDNALTYDALDSKRWRTSLSASIINLQKDSQTAVLESGRKTLRGKATIEYTGWSHWRAGLMLTHDLLGRGAGTAVSPSLTYRQSLSEDSTILLSQAFTWANGEVWGTSQDAIPWPQGQSGGGWRSADTSVTLRQRWNPHWSWFGQINRSHALSGLHRSPEQERNVWSGQVGVIYFSR